VAVENERGRVGLGEVSGTQASEDGCRGKENGESAEPEPVGQGALGVLRRHAERSDQPHPECGTGSSDRDRGGDSGDVSVSERRRERNRQRLKRGHVARHVAMHVSAERSLQDLL